MALQGNLRDFSATEILQLLGNQRKTGCLTLEHAGQRHGVHVLDGRIVSTRMQGLAKDDPLFAFLQKIHRLSDEQVRGIVSIQKESGRDLEDLLLNGRYLDEEELAQYLERQMLDDLMRVTRWEEGVYRFDPHMRWQARPLVQLGVEATLMEAARRGDERRRYQETLRDPQLLLGVRDLPDPTDELTEEERELFGIIDGQHTLAEVVAAAPLTEYETYEALHRLIEANWIEIVGRRDGGAPAVAARPQMRPAASRVSWLRELALVGLVLVSVAGLRVASRTLFPPPPATPDDVFVAAQLRDVRFALELYHREHGAFPMRLEQLVDDRWLSPAQLRTPGGMFLYHPRADLEAYSLELERS
jgi:uncharacterized protein DUF4388